jgi:DNA-directed RNA polymerase subunit beta
MDLRNFKKVGDAVNVPNLVAIQTDSYKKFLQLGDPPEKRKDTGLEAIFRETFPILSYDGSLQLEYVRYDLGRPRYTPDECRQLGLTYGRPLTITVRFVGPETVEEDVYLGDIPIMMGGGEFIINGAERVIVSQLHRSPGVDFEVTTHATGKKLHSCRIIPERGSWIELSVSKKDVLSVKIDQSGKFPATTLLRAVDEQYGTTEDLLRMFYETKVVKLQSKPDYKKLTGMVAVGALVNAATGEIIVESGGIIDETAIEFIAASSLDSIEVIPEVTDPLILNTIAEDRAHTYEESLERIYKRLRPGNPFQLKRAQQLFEERFFDQNRYRLGRVGRFRLNRKFNQNVSETEMVLRADDLVNAFRYLIELRSGAQRAATLSSGIDDIDHLGNRRVRTIDELGGDEIRKGLLKLRRTAQERMSMKDPQDLTPRALVNPRTVSSSIDFFFGRSELSQVVDQINPLAMLTHERRLSALGPGGLNRKRAGFEVRDVHTSHYGRICPIETPEGTNIGLIVSLSIFAEIDEYGFLVTPYRKVKSNKVSDETVYLRADEEDEVTIAPADAVNDDGTIPDELMARKQGEFTMCKRDEIDYVDVSPKQLVGISAALIPFLEHNDANRALMGSNMQRQAVPLVTTEPPLIGTGMEEYVARNSGMVVVAEEAGTVQRVTADEIVIDNRIYTMRKFVGMSSRTCLNQKPIVREGDRVTKGQVIADGASTHEGRLALGKNVFVAFMPFDGFNYEDAILISEKLVQEDVYTSIHIDEFEIEVRETKLGREEFTADIPNVPERALAHLDEDGIIRVGTWVKQGDILVGKVAPKSKTELSPEEKLLHAIFGRAGEDVKNESLEVPSGTEGIVIDARKFSRKAQLSGEAKTKERNQLKKIRRETDKAIYDEFMKMIEVVSDEAGGVLVDGGSGTRLAPATLTGMSMDDVLELEEAIDPEQLRVVQSGGPRRGVPVPPKARRTFDVFHERIEAKKDEKDRRISQIKRGDELPPGVLEMVKIYVATKRTLSVGDKMAGRHGNKGVIAKILPEEDMPYLEDGSPVGIVLNPLGVPSRMNIGQILETHLGWAAKTLGYDVITPVFDGAHEEEIRRELERAGLPPNGKARLYDGRTGEPFDQEVTVGYMYVLKLEHLVDDKVHARATGPYSLITQQPLGGKARSGGQRFGEMEVWALEAYGAAHVLQELLTVKADDVEGRTRIYEAMVKGENTLIAGTPVSFDVLLNEIRGLGLNIKLERKKPGSSGS